MGIPVTDTEGKEGNNARLGDGADEVPVPVDILGPAVEGVEVGLLDLSSIVEGLNEGLGDGLLLGPLLGVRVGRDEGSSVG